MRTRQEIKAIGKNQFIANYWPCVLVPIIVGVILGVIAGIGNLGATGSIADGTYEPGPLYSVMSLVSFIITGPLTVGVNYFYVMNVLGRADQLTVTTPITEAMKNFGRKLGGCLWMELFIFLWGLLLFVPGIIKALSYSMTPYILADCPNVKAKDALKLSMRIMNGHKWEYFVFGLSFLGWLLLNCLTLGLLSVFYVGPYMNSSTATYYLEVREQALRTGVITMGQLEGVEPV